MNNTVTKQESCADRVARHCESRLEDLRLMMSPDRDDVALIDDGTLDTVLQCGNEEFRYSQDERSAYCDDETGEFDIDTFIDDRFDDIRDTMYERFSEYGLSFDYVEPHTFRDQDEGYLRYQISWGGPSEEIRFYVSLGSRGYQLYRAEFWLLDWFDGVHVNVTNDERARNNSLQYAGLEVFRDGELVADTFCDSYSEQAEYLNGLTAINATKRLADWLDV